MGRFARSAARWARRAAALTHRCWLGLRDTLSGAVLLVQLLLTWALLLLAYYASIQTAPLLGGFSFCLYVLLVVRSERSSTLRRCPLRWWLMPTNLVLWTTAVIFSFGGFE